MKRSFLMLVLFISIVLLFLGCGKGTKPKAQQVDTTKPYNLVYVAGQNPEVFQKDFAGDDYLKKKFPNLTIEYHPFKELDQLLLTGNKPDIINYWGYSLVELKEAGLLGDMSDLIKKNNFDMSQFLTGHLDYIKKFGKSPKELVAIPDSNKRDGFTDFAMVYNKDIFDHFGAAYPKDGMTLDEVLELAKRMDRTDGGVEYQGLTHYFGPVHWFKTLGLTYLNDKGKVDLSNPLWQELFKFHQRTLELGTVNELWVPNVKFMKDRNIAMHIGPITPVKNATIAGQLDDFKWDMVTFPHFKGTKPNSVPMELGVYVIPSVSKNRDIAFEFIKTKLSKEYSQKRVDEVLNSPQMKTKNLNAIKKSKLNLVPYVPTQYEQQWQNTFVKVLKESAAKNIDYNTAIRQLEEQFQKKIDEINANK